MSSRWRLCLLICIMGVVALMVTGVTILILYRTSMSEEEQRLLVTAKSHARLIEAVARFNAIHSINYPRGPVAATLSQITDAHGNYEGFGETGEFVLARREGNLMIFILRHRRGGTDVPQPIAIASDLAEPMRRALSGISGTTIGLDYRGETVIAAHEPIGELNMGIVAKIDLVEVRAPFVRAGVIAVGVTLLVVTLGSIIFVRVTNPMIRRLTEYSERLAELVDTDRKLSRAVEQSPATVVITDITGNIEYVNPKFTQMTGYSFEEVVGKNPRIFKSGKHPPEMYEQLWGTITSGGEWSGELCNAAKNGEFFWEFVSISPIKNAEGEITHFVGVKEDITERKRAEMRLREATLYLENIIKSMADILIVTDRHGTVETVNKACLTVLGYEENEIVGNSIGMLFEEGSGFEVSRFIKLVEPEALLTLSMILETKSNEAVPVSLSGSVIRESHARHDAELMDDRTGGGKGEDAAEVLGIVIVARDMRASGLMKELEASYEELKLTQAHLVQSGKMAAIGQFAAGIAHEVRNPLTAITMNTAFLLERTTDEESLKELKTIEMEANRTARIVSSLLSFSKPANEKRVPMDINRLIEETLIPFEHQISLSDVEIVRDLDPHLPKVNVIANEIIQIFLNLINNAVDAMPGGGKLFIQTSIEGGPGEEKGAIGGGEPPQQLVCIKFRDTGQGIPEEELASLFTPFFTTKDPDKGVGLGLFISHKIAKKHQGGIVVNSTVGEGSAFTLRLPVNKGDVHD